jgi:hypothetical protein
MKKTKMPERMLSLLLVSLLLASLLAVVPVTNAQPVQGTGFNLVSTQWGTPSAPAEAGPGEQDVPITITLQYYFANAGSSVSVTLELPAGFTDMNGNLAPTSYVSGVVPSGAVLPFVFYLDIGSGVGLGSYVFPMVISWDAITPPAESVPVTQTIDAVIALKGNVQLQFSAAEPTVSPGTVTHLPITVSNIGTGPASNITLNVSPASSALASAAISVLSNPPQIMVLPANSSAVTTVEVYVPSTATGSTISLAVTGSFTDAYGNPRPVQGALGIVVASVASSSIAVSVQSPSLTPGQVNNVTLTIEDVSQEAVRQLTVGVSVPPSISVLSHFPQTISGLAAGSSAELEMQLFVSAGLSGSSVTIAVSVTYTDSFGNPGSLTQSLGFYVPTSQGASIALSGYSYTPSLIYPGTTVASLQVAIVNSGTTTASNINATLVPASPVYAISKGSLSRYLGFLPQGQTVSLAFTLGILNSSQPLNSTLNLYLQYAGGKPLDFVIPFAEQPEAVLKVVYVSFSKISAGDGADQVVVTLRNTGEAAAQGLTLTMQPSYVFSPSSFATSSAAGAGTIAPGASTDLTMVIQVNSNVQAGTYPLVSQATWSQLGSAQPFGQDITLELPVSASSLQVANALLVSPILIGALVILVILVVLFVVVRRERRRRSWLAQQTTAG